MLLEGVWLERADRQPLSKEIPTILYTCATIDTFVQALVFHITALWFV